MRCESTECVKIRLRPELRPVPRRGAYNAPHAPFAIILGRKQTW